MRSKTFYGSFVMDSEDGEEMIRKEKRGLESRRDDKKEKCVGHLL